MRNFLKVVAALILAAVVAGCVPVQNTPLPLPDMITASEQAGQVTVTSSQFGSHTFPKGQVCDALTLYINDGPHWTVGRKGPYLTLAGQETDVNCGPMPRTGGDNNSEPFVDGWTDSDLVEDDGQVTIRPGEVVTEHPSTAPTDSGFIGNGPGSIDG